MTQEEVRLAADRDRTAYWKKWGSFLSERQWGTVREDYSPDGSAWDFFPHDHARSRAYRWGEDGIAGISDNHQQLCFAIALWNGEDAILKERIFGLTGNEGNHGEDVKEYYFYLFQSLQNFHNYFGDDFKVECPTGSGQMMTLKEVAIELAQRLIQIFLADASGQRPFYGETEKFQTDPNWQDLIMFNEYFHGENGAGIGASHQTGWTGLVAKLIQQCAEHVL